MKRVRPLQENFRDFMTSAETHQRPQNPYVDEFMELGANPFDDLEDEEKDLPFNFERRPEIGERINSIQARLEQLEALSQAGLNKLNKLNRGRIKDSEMSPYIKRQFDLAYQHLREGYLRLMDM
jgi:hypothetical protein